MKKDKILELIPVILALFSSTYNTVVDCSEESYVIGKKGEAVDFDIKIYDIPEDKSLEYILHPSTQSLFIVTTNNGKIQAVTQPTASSFRERLTNVDHSEDAIRFKLKNVSENDAGIYRCQLRDCQQKLILSGKPVKPVVKNLGKIIAYEKIEFNCSTSTTSLPKDHGLVMKYIWRKNGEIISKGSNSSILFMVDRSNEEDRITCQAYELDNLKSASSDPLILNPDFEPENIEILPSSEIKTEIGSSLTVTCNVECRPSCNITWKRNNEAVAQSKTLKFSGMTRSNTGEYVCHAENELGTSEEGVTINVLYEPVIESEKLKDITSYLKEFSTLNISVEIDSNPKPEIHWLKDGTNIPHNDTTMELSGPNKVSYKYIYTSVFRLIQAQCQDMANYSSIISNQFGSVNTSVYSVKILCKPRVDPSQYFKSEFAPDIGDSVVINMRVIAYPRPVIQTIYHNGSVLPPSAFNVTQNNPELDYLTVFTLTKSDITLKELGIYHIQLSNSEKTVNITVHFKEKGRPSIPEDLSVVQINALSVTLQWTSTFNGGANQTFNVWYKHLYGNWTFYNQTYHDRGEGSTITAEIKGLRDLTSYLFRVAAKNVYGRSDFTQSLPVTTPESKIHIESASVNIGMWVGIALALVVLIIAVIIAIFFIRKKYIAQKKERFFKEIRDAGTPMMPGQMFDDLANKENHYEEITEHRIRENSPSSSNGTCTTSNNNQTRTPAPSTAPPKPPRTFEEPVVKKPVPIWKPEERKPPKVNENTLHLAVARKSLKPVVNKGQL